MEVENEMSPIVMPSALDDLADISFYAGNQPVPVIDATAPPAGKLIFQGFWLAEAFVSPRGKYRAGDR